MICFHPVGLVSKTVSLCTTSSSWLKVSLDIRNNIWNTWGLILSNSMPTWAISFAKRTYLDKYQLVIRVSCIRAMSSRSMIKASGFISSSPLSSVSELSNNYLRMSSIWAKLFISQTVYTLLLKWGIRAELAHLSFWVSIILLAC